MIKGAVFFDYDGTLTEEDRKIYRPTPKTVAAAKELQQKGYLVGLATGRSKCYVPEVGIDFDCYITTNGAYADYLGEEIWNDTFTLAQVKRFLDFLAVHGINYILENQEACYCRDREEKTLVDMIETFQLPPECFRPISDMEQLPINKIVLTYDSLEKLKLIQEEFGGEYEITPHRTCYSCDVARKGITKAVGIAKVLERLQIPCENTYAFGDGDNDIDMFRLVGTAIAMKDHAESLDSVAAHVTGNVEDEGIYYGLKHFGLID